MYQEDKSFTLRFSLEASFPDDYDGEEDRHGWIQDWEYRIKPHLLKTIFESLRQHSAWKSHIRNRGMSPADEIEIVLSRDLTKRTPFNLS